MSSITLRFEPDFFGEKRPEKDSENCPQCLTKLKREIKEVKVYKGDECGYCRYSDRPFGHLTKHYGGCCSCKYEIQDVLCIICEECILNRCYDCKEPQKLTFRNKRCDVCKNKYNKEIWNQKSIKDKLEEYSKKELINLCINKSVKQKSSMKKTELINLLEPFMIDSDFSYDHTPVKKWPF